MRRMACAPLAAVMLAAASRGADAAIRVCGTHNITDAAAQSVQSDLNATMSAMLGTTNTTLAGARLTANAQESAGGDRKAAAAALPATGINVAVYFQVISSGSSVADGNVTDSTVAAQIAVRLFGAETLDWYPSS